MTAVPPRRGRPRHGSTGESGQPGQSGRDDILRAAADLFVESGFAATSTRAIAEKAGIRQASLYYHFAGKDEILAELLRSSVRPSLAAARALGEDASPAAALYALALNDVHTLAITPHNIGTLYLLPEVRQPRYDGFRADRTELQRIYTDLGSRVAGDHPDSAAAQRRGELLIHLVEVVIQQRRTRIPDVADAAAIAQACLRICGATGDQITTARREAARLIEPAAAAAVLVGGADDAGEHTTVEGNPG